jgi:hypothetical protein
MSSETLTFDGLDICLNCVGEVKARITGNSSYRVSKVTKYDPMDAGICAFFDNGGDEVVQAVRESCGEELV